MAERAIWEYLTDNGWKPWPPQHENPEERWHRHVIWIGEGKKYEFFLVVYGPERFFYVKALPGYGAPPEWDPE